MKNAPLFAVKEIPITLIRKGQGSYNEVGVWEEAIKFREVRIMANVHPAGYTEVRMLPEVERSKKAVNVYSSSEIRMQKEGTNGWDADEFEYEGEMYRVMKVERYSMGILNHYHAVAVRKELTP